VVGVVGREPVIDVIVGREPVIDVIVGREPEKTPSASFDAD
jgi:hypothetical protein